MSQALGDVEMHGQVRLSVLAVLVIGVTGCGHRYIADRATNPVLEDYVNHGKDDAGLAVLSTKAHLRNAYVQLLPEGKVGLICAEPPADVGEAFAKSFAAGVDTGKVDVTVSSAAASAIAPLLYRSQGLQMYRDAVSHLCFMRMNNIIKDDAEFVRLEQKRWDAAIELVKEETKAKYSHPAPAGQQAPKLDAPPKQAGSGQTSQ